MDNYVVYHLHSDLSNGVTNVDSVTKFGEYIEAAKNCGMKALGFSEHGSVFEWWHKKCAIEAAGMKYLHGVEAYVTESITEKVRDNYHCVLIARNFQGFRELNKLITASFNRKDGHFYYVPRITFDELENTSENIIVTSACVGGVLGKGNDQVKKRFLSFLSKNSDRCFLEIGHHVDGKQVLYNRELVSYSEEYGIRLIAGTDTHVLNEEHEKGRSILQLSKNIIFDGEEGWDLKFKSYEQLLEAYKLQDSIDEKYYLEAISNTNVLADMVKPFELNRGTKYPHIYENPEETFRKKIDEAIEKHPYALQNHMKEELEKVVDSEFEVYKKTKSIDFMLLQTYLREWEKGKGIKCGYGRGSVSGSMIAYLLGITQMDSVRFGLNFFRFMNPDRVTNADIDTDYSEEDRAKVKEFLLRDKMNLDNINSAEIITFNTIALKGAIRDVCRALYKNAEDKDYLSIADMICKEVETDEQSAREKYTEVFEYVDLINGTIVSIGTHPSGVLISDLPIDETIGLCSLSSSDYPVSMINMKELDDLMYVKLDVLGLANIGLINDTCDLIGIERLTPDNVDLYDDDVWKSIRDDTTMIFQWESNSAQQYLRKFMSDKTLEIAKSKIPGFSMIKWLSFGNGLIRPACASFRDSVANGEFYDNGFDALNEFLAPEAGRIAMQETIMRFLVKFCGYNAAESDTVRRAIAKKKGTEQLLPEIEQRFVDYTTEHYGLSVEKAESVIKPFLQIILDASAYGFSWNHSDSYSCIGYISGYLRYYYPYEFIVSALNTFSDNAEKTAAIVEYAQKRRGIVISMPRWGISRSSYAFDKSKKIITKGLASVKFMNERISEELYELSKSKNYTSFTELLMDIDTKTSVNTRQLDILIKIDFFNMFGNQRELLLITENFYEVFKKGDAKKIPREKVDGTVIEHAVSEHSTGILKNGFNSKFYSVIDMHEMMLDSEKAVMAKNFPDLEDVVKVRNFAEVMGYIGYMSGKEEDRRKLYVTELKPLHRKRDGKKFGYSVFTKSIGSGVESRFTLMSSEFQKMPFKKGDIIYCQSWVRDGQYFRMTKYAIL